MTDPKVLGLVALLIVALFVLSVVLGGTRPGDTAFPDPDDSDEMAPFERLESILHRLPGLGPGRHLERGDFAGPGCDAAWTGRELAWRDDCVVRIPDEVGRITFGWPGEQDAVSINVEEEGALDQSYALPADLEDIDERTGQGLEVRLFGEAGELTLHCPRVSECRLILLGGDG